VTKLLVAVGFLALNLYTYYWMAQEAVIPARDSFASFPRSFDDWRCNEPVVLADDILANLGATDYFICNYARLPDDRVEFYIGYHETQIREEGGGAGENSIHPPAHCLPGSGWDIVDNQTVELDVAGLPGSRRQVKRLMIARGQARQLVYYWYQSRGRIIAEDWQKIVYVGWDRATRSRTDGSLVRFTVPVVRGNFEKAEDAFLELASLVVPQLPRFAPN
jgi:EpsI family protein